MLKKVFHKLKTTRDLQLLWTSGLFDKDWYLKNNPDVAQGKMYPLLHYYKHGGLERRHPGPDFNSGWYLDTYPDAQAAGINPLLHYLKHGRFKGHKPLPSFSSRASTVNTRKNKHGSLRRITFFVYEPSEFQAMKPVALEASTRGYETVFTKNFQLPVEIGVYCKHFSDASNSRFSIIMLHDLGQEQWPECPSLEPNFWSEEPWDAFDIGILPGQAWSQCWLSVSTQAAARPRLGVFDLGWPKADIVFNDLAGFDKEVDNLRKVLQLKDRPSVLYAPSFENDGKQDDFIRSLIHLPVNLLIKQAPWPDKKNRDRIRETTAKYQGREEDGIYVIDPDTSIMTCLALSDVLVSDESNCLIEALLFEVPGIAVTDWLIPAIPNYRGVDLPPRFAEPPSFAIKTTRAELETVVKNTLCNREKLRPKIRELRDYYFSHLGQSSAVIMDLIEAALAGAPLPVAPLPPMVTKKIKNDQWGIKPAGVHIIAVENCTNRCEFCSTSAPFAGKNSYPASSFFPWLDQLFNDNQNSFRDTYIAITGGEPFLHANLFLFIDEMKEKYPLKTVGLTTNFYWASKTKIREIAPLLKSLDEMLISKYPITVNRIGGEEKFDELVLLLKYLCPHINVEVTPMINAFIKWDFHTDRQAVLNACCTAFCYMLKADGKLFRCSLACGLEHRPEYRAIQNLTPERYFDISKGLDGFSEWSSKYPIDLCHHCTFWKHEYSVWKNSSKTGQRDS